MNDGTVWGHSRSGVLLLWAGGHLQFLDQVLGCSAGMAQSTGLHRSYTGVLQIVSTGATSGTAGVCGFVVTGVAGATGRGCGSCAGLSGAGAVAEM